MEIVMSELEKDVVFTVFTRFQSNYLKANSGKSHLLTTSDNVLDINVKGNQLNSSKHEELKIITKKYTPWQEYQSTCLKRT